MTINNLFYKFCLDVSDAGIDITILKVGSDFISFSWHRPINSQIAASEYIISLRKIPDAPSDDVIEEDVVHKRTTKLKMTVEGLKPSTMYEIKVGIVAVVLDIIVLDQCRLRHNQTALMVE